MYPDPLSSRTVGASAPTLRGRLSAFTLPQSRGRAGAFTLIELLVVITIIAILMGLLFPVFRGVQDQAKKTQAKNDLTQIVNAVNAFYTEYGVYPVDPTFTADAEYGNPDKPAHSNSDVMNALRAIDDPKGGPNKGHALNPKQVIFFNGPTVKDAKNPRAGFDSNGEFWDPWGSPPNSGPAALIGHYIIIIDCNYNGLTSAYTLGYSDLTYETVAPDTGVRVGAIAASLGKDGGYGTVIGNNPPNGDNKFKGSDDVISWQ
ncbi:MAG: ral secretion pathway protein [Verrucomicrobiota bacterium]